MLLASVSESCWLLENSTRSRLRNSPLSIQLKALQALVCRASRWERVSRRYHERTLIFIDVAEGVFIYQ